MVSVGEGGQTSNSSAVDMAMHLAQNPFLATQNINREMREQSLIAFRIDQPFAFCMSQVQVLPRACFDDCTAEAKQTGECRQTRHTVNSSRKPQSGLGQFDSFV